MSLILGDCLEQLKLLGENSVHGMVTDPPAGISFMNKEWDTHDNFIPWMTEVMRECLRVLKPGAHALVWAIPRTSHWTATAVENAGFEIRDVVTHLFGSGFPKSLDISKAIDKQAGAERQVIGFNPNHRQTAEGGVHETGTMCGEPHTGGGAITAPATDDAKKWQGFGTALKPAAEFWILARKPLSEKTVASNVLKHGTGGLNIDGCRIESEANRPTGLKKDGTRSQNKEVYGDYHPETIVGERTTNLGRFPANLVLSHTEECYDAVPPDSEGKACDAYCSPDCAVAELDRQSGVLDSGGPSRNPEKYKDRYHDKADKQGLNTHGKYNKKELIGYADKGGASRFFYVAKASTSEKNKGLETNEAVTVDDGRDKSIDNPFQRGETLRKNSHPTVKAVKLMRYLCRLITPPGGVILDPFMGSGSTGIAAREEGFQFIGIEKDKEYFEIARARIEGKP